MDVGTITWVFSECLLTSARSRLRSWDHSEFWGVFQCCGSCLVDRGVVARRKRSRRGLGMPYANSRRWTA